METRFSFWKPSPLPETAIIARVELLPFGKLKDVAEMVLDIPRITVMPSMPWEESIVNAYWDVEEGAMLRISPESGQGLCPGQVVTIPVATNVSFRTFYRLYIHIFEQFGSIVLNETDHRFMTPMQYKRYL